MIEVSIEAYQQNRIGFKLTLKSYFHADDVMIQDSRTGETIQVRKYDLERALGALS